ncbi:MAG: hypothetical protein N4A40_16255 [Tissierellales bacterium]|nr:hypothetical protein [Tissierellales bacterium]
MLRKRYSFIFFLVIVFFLTSCSKKIVVEKKELNSDETVDYEEEVYSQNSKEEHILEEKYNEAEHEKMEKLLKKILEEKKQSYSEELIKQFKVYNLNKNEYLLLAPLSKQDKRPYVESLIAKIDEAEDELKTQFVVGNFVANFDKLEVKRLSDNRFLIWSQYSEEAVELDVVVELKKNGFKLISSSEKDPTREYYESMVSLLRQGDVESAKSLDDSFVPEYTHNYQDYYFKVATMAVRVAHDYAFLTYRREDLTEKEKLKLSKEALDWGLDKYLMAQIGIDSNVESVDVYDRLFDVSGYRSQYSLKKPEFAGVLNDIAYFDYELGHYDNAETLMRKVLEYDPDRLVAQINIGDVLWKQAEVLKDQKKIEQSERKFEESKKYYRNYVEFLGMDNSVIPDRVFQRLGYYNKIEFKGKE